MSKKQTELLASALEAAGLPAATAAVGRTVAYLPALAGPFGGAKCAILISQLLYWRPRSTNPEGWVYKSAAELQDETGLSYEEQRTARQHLRELKVLEERHRRLEHRVYFRLNMERLADVYRQSQARTSKTPIIFPNGESPVRKLEKAHLGKPEMPGSEIGKSPLGETGNAQFDIHRGLTENTAEMTTEETNGRSLSDPPDRSVLECRGLALAFFAEVRRRRPDWPLRSEPTKRDLVEAGEMFDILQAARRKDERTVRGWITWYARERIKGGPLDYSCTMAALRQSWPEYKPRAPAPAHRQVAAKKIDVREDALACATSSIQITLITYGVVLTATLLAESIGAEAAVERVRAALSSYPAARLCRIFAATAVYEPSEWPGTALLTDWRQLFADTWKSAGCTEPKDAGRRGEEAAAAIRRA